MQATASNTISLTIANADAGGKSIIYTGVSTSLGISLVNDTGNDLALPVNCTLEIYMPSYFTVMEIGAMAVTAISQAGWNFTYDADDVSLLLTWAGATAGTWTSGSTLTFNITNVLSNAQPTSDIVQVNFTNLTGNNIPAEVTETLALLAPAVPGNADLGAVLQTDLEFQGQIYVSTSLDPLTNTLYLNLKNTGSNPLYNGSSMWQGNPKIIVSFVYGNTSGALAPADKANPTAQGSAWSISGAVSVDQTGGWSIQNPSATGQANSPSWIFSPTSTNQEIIGTGAEANVTFAFSNLFSFTPSGATQMYVQFTGFTQDEHKNYNDELFTLNINKLPFPSITGLLNFYNSPDMYIYTGVPGNPAGTATANLFWAGFDIASVTLEYDITGRTPAPPPLFTKSYPDTVPLVQDHSPVVILDVVPGDQVNFTLLSYNQEGSLLSSLSFAVTVEAWPQITSFTGKFVPAATGLELHLNWTTAGATTVQASWTDEVLSVNPSQPVVISFTSPSRPSNTYTLNVANSNGVTGTPSSLITAWGEVAQRIPLVSPSEIAVSPDGKYALVTTYTTLTIIEIGTLQVVQVIDMTQDKPNNTVVSPDGRYLYVASPVSPISVVDLSATPMVVTQQVNVQAANSIAISPDGRYVFVSTWNMQLVMIDTSLSPMAVINTINLNFLTAGLVVSTNNQSLYVLFSNDNPSANTIARFDIPTLLMTGPQPTTVGALVSMTATPDGKYVLVVDQQANTLSVLDALSAQLNPVNVINLPGPPGQAMMVTMMQDGLTALVACGSYMCLIDIAGARVVGASLPVGYVPNYINAQGVAVTPDGYYILALDVTQSLTLVVPVASPSMI